MFECGCLNGSVQAVSLQLLQTRHLRFRRPRRPHFEMVDRERGFKGDYDPGNTGVEPISPLLFKDIQ